MTKEVLVEEEVELLTKERFDKIMLKFLIDEPFFSDIMRCIRKEMTDMIPTAGVIGTLSLYPSFQLGKYLVC